MGLLDRIRSIASGTSEPLLATEADATRLIAEGNALEDRGSLADAMQRYDAAVRLAPGLTRAHLNRGNALLAMNEPEAAAGAYARAVALNPEFAGAHFNLGNALLRVGRVQQAVGAYRKAIALRRDFADAEVALGVALSELGQFDEAVASYRRALAISPGYAEVHINLGHALCRMDRLDEAEASYRSVLDIKPAYVDAHRGLAGVLRMLGRLDAAAASYRQALAISPDLASVHNDLGNVLQERGLLDEALAAYGSALATDPKFVEAHSNAGRAHLKRGRVDEAIACQRRALAIKPDFAEAHFNLGNTLRDGGHPSEAIASYLRALALKPDFAHAYVGLGEVQKELGSLGEAQASFRRALDIDPGFQEAQTSLLFCLSHDESVDPAALFAEHLRFGDRFEAPLRARWPLHRNSRDPERRLKVGFVSGDLRAHPVAYFVEPLLQHLEGYRSLSLHAYSNHAEDDAVSLRLRRHFQSWQAVAGLLDAVLANRISEDGIDILIDLSGHTSRNRLRTFARKPAPVQASWMGYPGTTGLAAIDYYFADRHFLPFAEFEGQFTEKLVHLPASAPFLPDPSAPPVTALPALSNGYLTFASFNRPSKLRPSVIALWSRLLRALPDARMSLGAMPQDGQYGHLLDLFAAEGIVRERLEFHARCDTPKYLALHEHVDVCLDTFPYTGGTTTAHALWMGVPTLTMAGRTPAGRQGAAILGQVGLQSFVATDADDFVRKGVRLAASVDALATMRARLRTRCDETPQRKPETIAIALEYALRLMWKRWCADLRPEAFAVATDDAAGQRPPGPA